MTPALTGRTWIVFAAALALYVISSGLAHPTVYNNYVLLADALLHGRGDPDGLGQFRKQLSGDVQMPRDAGALRDGSGVN